MFICCLQSEVAVSPLVFLGYFGYYWALLWWWGVMAEVIVSHEFSKQQLWTKELKQRTASRVQQKTLYKSLKHFWEFTVICVFFLNLIALSQVCFCNWLKALPLIVSICQSIV